VNRQGGSANDYTHPFSIVPLRVRIALHEKGLEYESVTTDLFTKAPEPSFPGIERLRADAERVLLRHYLEQELTRPELRAVRV
jgi:hypothetical protein